MSAIKVINHGEILSWYEDGKLHRTDGPAIEWSDGDCSWFLDNVSMTFEAWCEKLHLTKEEITLIKLKYG